MDLNIVNGSEGFLRGLELKPLPCGAGQYAAVAIVEFPRCPIQLEGLPPSHFPIYPKSTKISTNLVHENGRSFTLTASRHQLPLQLGFASTTHGAQGKTLPCVGSDMNCGGAKSYVIASRAQNRNGLVLVRPVTLARLNTPVDSGLVIETARLKALEHNTLIEYGFCTGQKAHIPDPKGDLREFVGSSSFSWSLKEPRTRSTKAGPPQRTNHPTDLQEVPPRGARKWPLQQDPSDQRSCPPPGS